MSQTKAQLIDGKSAEIEFTGGSASGPAISFTGDSNTGIYSPGADQVAVSTGGTGRLFVDASGRLGVGTASPSSLFHLSGNSGTAVFTLSDPANGMTGKLAADPTTLSLGTTTNHAVLCYTNSVERLRITSAGLVGIGVSAPGAILDVAPDANRNLQVQGRSGTTYGLEIKNGTANSAGEFHVTAASSGSVVINRGTTEIARFTSTGLAIGTTAPTEKLHIHSTGNNPAYLHSTNDGTGTGATDGIVIGMGDATNAYLWNYENGGIVFATNATQRAVIDSSGRLLVGTSTARTKWFNATVNAPLIQSETTTLNVFSGVQNANDPTGPWIILGKSRGSSAGAVTVVQAEDRLGAISFQGADGTEMVEGAKIQAYVDGAPGANDLPTRLTFSTTADGASSPTERLRITSSGNVGIGASPSAKLHVNTGTDENLWVGSLGGSGAGIYLASVNDSGSANTPMQIGSASVINFAINGTEAARIDTSRRLLVGTSTGTSRLSIAGTADNANSEIQITATGVASGYIGANSNGLNIGTDTAGLVFKTGVAGGGSVGASGTERMRIDSSGRLLIGTSTSIAPNESPGSGKVLQIAGTAAGQDVGIGVYNYSPAGWAPNIQLGQSHGGTTGTHAAVVDGGILGSIAFAGSDGTKFVRGALIQAVADGGVSTDDLPTRLVFSTTADGASSPGEAMRIPSGKNVLLSGCASDTLTVTNTSGAGTTSTLIVGRYSNSVGTTNGPACLLVYTNGNVVNTNNSYGAISDLKLKENIVDANSQWDDLKALQVRNYNFKEGQTHTQIGLVAQEAELVSPGLVSESPDRDEDGNDLGTVTKSVNYSVLYMKAVKALQEAIAKIETLEGMVAVNNITIDEQQHQLSTLAARLTALENA
jgi:hypothetical protein